MRRPISFCFVLFLLVFLVGVNSGSEEVETRTWVRRYDDLLYSVVPDKVLVLGFRVFRQ